MAALTVTQAQSSLGYVDATKNRWQQGPPATASPLPSLICHGLKHCSRRIISGAEAVQRMSSESIAQNKRSRFQLFLLSARRLAFPDKCPLWRIGRFLANSSIDVSPITPNIKCKCKTASVIKLKSRALSATFLSLPPPPLSLYFPLSSHH